MGTLVFQQIAFIKSTKIYLFQIMTATVETVSEQLDLAAIIPAERVVNAVAKAITLAEIEECNNCFHRQHLNVT